MSDRSVSTRPGSGGSFDVLVDFARSILGAHEGEEVQLEVAADWVGCDAILVMHAVRGGAAIQAVASYERPQLEEGGDGLPTASEGTEADAPLAWRAVREKRAQVLRAPLDTDETRGRPGYALSVALPLQVGGLLWGAIEAHWIEPCEEVDSALAALEMVGLLTASRQSTAAPVLRAESEVTRLLDQLPACVMIHRDEEVLYVNASFARTLGYPVPWEVVGKSLSALMCPDDLEALSGRISSPRVRGVVPSFDERYLRQDETVAVVEFARFPVEFDRLTGVCAVGFDVTERRALDAKLTSVDRMASVGALAGGVAHEINNPLAAVLANVDFALEVLSRGGEEGADDGAYDGAYDRAYDREGGATRREKPLDVKDIDELSEVLSEVRDAAERIQRVVKDLRNLVNAPTGVIANVELELVIRTAMRAARAELRHKARVMVQVDKVPSIQADPMGLTQVLLNLLLNAAGAIPEGRPADHHVTVRAYVAEPHVVLEVSDSGSGIPIEHQRRIFDPYYSTKPLGEGTGLGLAVSQRIIAAHGGQLELESHVGRGTTFRVLLPLPKPTSGPVVTGQRRARLLVVDDEPMVGQAIQRGLARAFDITFVNSALDALDALEAGNEFELILCDLVLPILSGKELYESIIERWPHLAERFIFLSGGAYTPTLKDFLEEMPNPHVEKPFRLAELRRLLTEHLERIGLRD